MAVGGKGHLPPQSSCCPAAAGRRSSRRPPRGGGWSRGPGLVVVGHLCPGTTYLARTAYRAKALLWITVSLLGSMVRAPVVKSCSGRARKKDRDQVCPPQARPLLFQRGGWEGRRQTQSHSEGTRGREQPLLRLRGRTVMAVEGTVLGILSWGSTQDLTRFPRSKATRVNCLRHDLGCVTIAQALLTLLPRLPQVLCTSSPSSRDSNELLLSPQGPPSPREPPQTSPPLGPHSTHAVGQDCHCLLPRLPLTQWKASWGFLPRTPDSSPQHSPQPGEKGVRRRRL